MKRGSTKNPLPNALLGDDSVGMKKRILIVRQDRLGDVVLATALPREIKKRWPDAHVAMLVRSYTRALFDHNPHVDEVLTDDYEDHNRTSRFWHMVGVLRRHRFTHALMALPQARINYMTFCAGIPWRVGHGLILFHVLTFVRPVMTRKFRKGRHEAEYAMDLARAIGVRTDDVSPEIHLSDGEKDAAKTLRFDLQSGDGKTPRRLIGIHTSSGASAPNWPPEIWADLVRRLSARAGVLVAVTDMEVPPVLADIPGVLYPSVGQTLRRDIVFWSSLDLLVSASTGPAHIAAALKVPTLSLFCPLPACEPALWGPLSHEARFVLPSAAYCRDRCPGDPHVCEYSDCLEVSPSVVAQKILAQTDTSTDQA